MTSSRQKLRNEIALVNNILQSQRARVAKCRRYLLDTLAIERLKVIVILLPAFLWGFSVRYVGLKATVRTLLLTLYTYGRKQFIRQAITVYQRELIK